jgi:hypothetical protein
MEKNNPERARPRAQQWYLLERVERSRIAGPFHLAAAADGRTPVG